MIHFPRDLANRRIVVIEKLLDEPLRLDGGENLVEDQTDPMEMVLDGENTVHSIHQDVDLTKGVFTKQLIRAYGFCRN